MKPSLGTLLVMFSALFSGKLSEKKLEGEKGRRGGKYWMRGRVSVPCDRVRLFEEFNVVRRVRCLGRVLRRM